MFMIVTELPACTNFYRLLIGSKKTFQMCTFLSEIWSKWNFESVVYHALGSQNQRHKHPQVDVYKHLFNSSIEEDTVNKELCINKNNYKSWFTKINEV